MHAKPSDLIVPILGSTLQENLSFNIELGIKLTTQLIGKLIHGLRIDHVVIVRDLGLDAHIA